MTEIGGRFSGNEAIALVDERQPWERYAPLLIPALLVAILLAYNIPAMPDLILLFLMWMGTVSLGMAFVTWQAIRTLMTSSYRRVRTKRNGKRIMIQKRRFVGSMIVAATFLVVVATWLWLSAILDGDFAYITVSFITEIMLAIICLVLFLLVWPRKPSSVELLLDHYGGFALTMILLFVALGVMTEVVRSILSEQVSQRPPASWEAVLMMAQGQADKYAKGAVVESMTAQPVYQKDAHSSSQTTVFKVDFVFRFHDGTSKAIRILGTDPPRLEGIGAKWGIRGANQPASVPTTAEQSSYVKLSAMDVYCITEQEGLRFAQRAAPGQSPEVHMSMSLADYWQKRYGVPAGWNVQFKVSMNGDARFMELWVDGASGTILEKIDWPDYIVRTPTPFVVGPTSTPSP